MVNKVSLVDLSRFTRQFAAMSSAGIPLILCLETLSLQTQNKILKTAIENISREVQTGSTLSSAVSKHPKIFNRLYSAMLKAGESGGILPAILLRLAEYQEKTVALQRKVKGAMTYPVIVAIIALGAITAFMTFVVPTFSSMLADLGVALPRPTRIIMGISTFLQDWIFYLFLLIAIIAGAIIILYEKKPKLRLYIDSLRLKIPLFGELSKKSAVSRFTRTGGSLLAGRVPITEALEITAHTADNRVIELALLDALSAIKTGKNISDSLKDAGIFPPMVIQMILVGEKTGTLPSMLDKISDYYDNELEASIGILTSVLEPLMIVIMGIIVAGILAAMYLPMLQIIDSLQ